MALKILLIAGHGANDPGACSSYGVERDETRKVVNKMVSLFKGYDVNVGVYPQNRNCYADVCNGNIQVNFANYDYVFEVHFNSASAQANGTEIFVTSSEANVEVEQKIVNNIAALGFTNRGVKRTDFAVIYAAKRSGTSSALVEVCFISNQNDMNRYKNSFNSVCNAMVKGIVDGFGIAKIPGVKVPENKPEIKPIQQPETSNFKPYVVKIVNSAIYVLDSPSPNGNIVRTVYKGNAYTIIDAKNGYGKLKSGLGWVNLSYTTPVSTQASNNADFKVKIVNDAIYVIDAPNPNANVKTTVHKNEVYTIVEVSGNYGKLKSGAGWINLNYTSKI